MPSSRATIFVLLVGVVLGAGAAVMAQADEPQAPAREVERKMRLPRPDLSTVSTPALEEALADPQRLWQFIIAPDTPYAERRAAVERGAKRLPAEYIPRIAETTAELRRERDVHHWGLRQHPLEAAPRPASDGSAGTSRTTVLGHAWMLPAQWRDYPITFEEEAAAPWPWQVSEALLHLLPAMAAPDWRGQPDATETPESTRWMAACLTMPVTSDAEADLFVEATLGGGRMRAKSLPVMARWRQIATDRDRPRAAERVAAEIAGVARLWRDSRSRDVAEVIVTDMLRVRPSDAARERAAIEMARLRAPDRDDEPLKPVPAAAVLAAAERAVDPTDGSAWLRLVAYGYGVCMAIDHPPIPRETILSARPDPGSPEAVAQLTTFIEWFRRREPRLRESAAERDAALRPLRDEMDRLAVRGAN